MSDLPAADFPPIRKLALQRETPDRLFPPLGGIQYLAALRALHQALGITRYFEIGSRHGDSLAQMRPEAAAVCVDPALRLKPALLAGLSEVHLYQATSDDYFARHDPRAVLGGPIQFAFIDGLHHSDAVMRDFVNTERVCDPAGAIVLHDCLPWSDAIAQRRPLDADAEGGRPKGAWTGDVWRVLPVLARLRPDLRITVLDCPPTGLVVVTGLDPKNGKLRKRLPQILEKLDKAPAPPDRLLAWLEEQAVTDSRAVAEAGRWREAIGLPP